ncbi:MAG: DUF6778 family protein [Pseudomonadota bacterium]
MTRYLRILALLGLGISTTACVSSDPAARDDLYIAPPRVETTEARVVTPIDEIEVADATFVAAKTGFEITAVEVLVPDYLVVSEAEVYVPQADIVWREDPLGNRHAQVKTIMENALSEGTRNLRGGQKVVLSARVDTFHALTEKARATFGGKHNIVFEYTLIDAETRKPVTGVRTVDASLKAFGGRRAYMALRRGETQKVRISENISKMIEEDLSEI